MMDRALRATVSVTFDDEFVVQGFKVVETSNGLIVEMPSTSDLGDIAFPTTSEFREYVEAEVLNAYHAAILRRNFGDEEADGVFAKLKTPPPTLFGGARLSLQTGEAA